MPQAINETTTTAAPPAPDLSAALEQMRRIACEAGDHLLLGDGPPNPDHALLDLCAEAIRLKRASETALAAWRATMSVGNPEYRSALEVHRAAGRAFKKALHHAKKYPAQTSAGIYAKAALVRSSQTGAGVLAMSLADDLLSMPGLRASLWPAGDVA
jgi:hypothetical protein